MNQKTILYAAAGVAALGAALLLSKRPGGLASLTVKAPATAADLSGDAWRVTGSGVWWDTGARQEALSSQAVAANNATLAQQLATSDNFWA